MTVDVPTQLRELAEVGSLSFQRSADSPLRTEFPKLAARLLAKREAHDAAIQNFAEKLTLISDGIEVDVKTASDGVVDALEEVDQRTSVIFDELNKDDLLVTKDADYLTETWEAIEGTLKDRHRVIRDFGERLEGLEQNRAKTAGGELRNLVDTLLRIAFKSPGEIERVVEGDAFELNAVIIANRKSHAELLALLEKKDVGVGLEAIEKWRLRREAWRQLRHDRAVREFWEDLESQKFVNPPERAKRFEKIRNDQLSSDEQRKKLIGEVEAMALPQSVKASEAKAKFKEIHAHEANTIVKHEKALDKLVVKSHEAALLRREDLRRELHRYGALAEEPDLEEFADFVEAIALDPEREDFFRSAGGLKPELRQLISECRHEDIVYARVLDEAKRRLQVVRCGRDLHTTLEKQGKGSFRDALKDTCERLRKGGRPEVPPLLPVLEQQVDQLRAVEGLDDLLVAELSRVSEDVRQLIDDIADQDGNENERKSMATSRKSSKRGATTAYTGYEGPAIDMVAVRSAQKRVAMMMCVCELEEEHIALLGDVQDALEQKTTCNIAIDEVCSQECEGVIAKRHEEHLDLAKEVTQYLEKQSASLCKDACQTCDFYERVGKAVEANHKNISDMDEAMEDDLFDIKEDQRVRNEDTEEELRQECHNTRHAADADALEIAFANVIKLLTVVEDQYRDYQLTARNKAEEHPVNDSNEAVRFDGVVRELFGLDGEEGETYVVGDGASRVVRLNLSELVKAVLSYEEPKAEEEPKVAIEGEEEEDEDEEEEPEVNWYAEGFVELTDEERSELKGRTLEKYLDSRDDAFTPLDAATKATLSEEDLEVYEALVIEVEEHRAARAEIREQGDVSDTPVDGNQEVCVEDVTLPESRLVELLDKLRASVVVDMETRAAARKVKIQTLTEERLTSYTEELEERLRTHWPRKGRSEVSFRQPREGELIAHRQRKERHLRVVLQRDRLHSKDFLDALSSSYEKVETFKTDLQALEDLLPKQQSLATLQGVESKCKKLAAAFHIECLAEVDALGRYTVTEPTKLFQLNEVLLKATRLFEDGGDFSEVEKEELRGKLDQVASRVEGSVAQRKEKVDTLRESQAQALQGLASFNATAETCLDELSLMYGLGMKYGAPRRNAQEKIRSNQTLDEREAAHFDSLLEALAMTCDEVKNPEDEDESTPRSKKLLALLAAIRKHARNRALYLNFLPKPDKVPVAENPMAQTSIPEPEAEEPAAEEGEEPVVKEVDPDDAIELDEATALLVADREEREGDLAQLVDDVEEACKAETKDLYTSEGKADRLGDDGVPDSLRTWLAESRRKVLGEGGYREKAARRLRAQVQLMETLIAKTPELHLQDPDVLGAPAAIVADVVNRCKAEADARRASTAQRFGEAMRAWIKKRDAHRSALRPQLGSPDSREELTQLCEAESVRREEVKAAVAEARETVIKDAAIVARRFLGRMASSSAECFGTLDGLTYNDDLGWLPGDENLFVKRKSLKRLRKMRRKAGPDAEGEILQETGLSYGEGRGRRFPLRTWPGVDAKAFAKVEEPPTPEEPAEEPAEDAEPTDGEAAPAEEEELEGPWVCVVASMGEARDALVTTAHRQLVRARDAAVSDYLAYYESSNADMLAHYDALVAEEESWHGTWEGLVKSLLVKSS